MRLRTIFLGALVSAWSLIAGAELVAGERVTMETSLGSLSFELWSDAAPKTVANFKKLAASGFYDGTAFHRVIRGTVVHGGDPLSKDSSQVERWGTGGPGYQVGAEINGRPHDFGVLSMAHDGNPNQAGSRFMICLGRQAAFDQRFTAFGKLVAGRSVLKAIEKVPVKAIASGERSLPIKRVVVKSVRVASP